MKRYLNSVEEVLKALKDDIIHDSNDGSFYKIVDGNICHFFKSGLQIINSGISIRETEINKYYTEESEPLKFEVNRAYKTRNGKKVYLFKIFKNNEYELYFVGGDGLNFWTFKNGMFSAIPMIKSENDIIGYWEEEK